jgi:hypothetical protein
MLLLPDERGSSSQIVYISKMSFWMSMKSRKISQPRLTFKKFGNGTSPREDDHFQRRRNFSINMTINIKKW